MSKENEQIQRIMSGLGCSEEEARSIYEYDCEVDHNSQCEYDLSPEKAKVAQKFTHTGTRKMKETGLRLTKRERKPNKLKGAIIEGLCGFLSGNNELSIENVAVLNKERQISFEIGDEKFELTLVQKRRAKN